MDSISHLLMPTQLAEESNARTVLPIPLYTHDFLYAVPRVSVSRRTLPCRFRRTYDMTKELQYYQIQISKLISNTDSSNNIVRKITIRNMIQPPNIKDVRVCRVCFL